MPDRIISALVLLLGLAWTLTPPGAAAQTSPALASRNYEKVVLDSTTTDPIELDVAPDGRVFYVERRGVIKIWHPDTETISVAGYLPVTIVNEDGLMGLTLDPNFAENGWMYLYYAPAEGPPRNQLSRFVVEGDSVNLDSETKILTVPTQREECCHTGGSMAFGPEGENLYLSTGDNTNPFASSGYAPIDERPGREPWDAQRTAANTQDLRGKILRINPQPKGGYTIPEGNLFGPSDNGRPEIYVMGVRNPYRISVDPETGWLYWGDVGPDAGTPDSARGPAGHDEFNQARGPGNYGWPYFVGNNKAYHDYDFAADTAGAPFNPAAPINDSPNNTGARVLPPAQPPMIWYPYGPSETFPEMGAGGRTAMAGPVYHYDAQTVGPHGLPPALDDRLLIYEWARNWVKAVSFDSTGHLASITPFLSGKTFRRPMDMEVGPHGRLYMIEWGNNFSGGPNSKVVRIDYYGSPERPPVATATASPSSGSLPLTVTLRANATRLDSSDRPLTYDWTLDEDEAPERRGAEATYTLKAAGRHTARLTVTDADGRSATDSVTVVAGNTRPTVSIDWPRPGGIVPVDTPLPYRLSVTDSEDASIAADRVVARALLLRDSHALPLREQSGPTGTFRITRTEHYRPKEALLGGLEACYTDGGVPGVAPARSCTTIRLRPKTTQAEYASATTAQRESLGDEGTPSYRTVLTVRDSTHAAYAPANLHGVQALTLHVAPTAGGHIEVRWNAPDGPLLAKTTVASAPGDSVAPDTTAADDGNEPPVGAVPSDWTDVTVPVSDPGTSGSLYLLFRGPAEKPLLKLDWIRFEGPGMTRTPSE